MAKHKIIDIRGLSKSQLIEKLNENKHKMIFLDIPMEGIQRLESFSENGLVTLSWLETNCRSTSYDPLDIDKRHYQLTDSIPQEDEDCLCYLDSTIVRTKAKGYENLNIKLRAGGLSIV